MEEENHELLLPLVQEENICLPLPINVVSKYWNIDLPMAEAVQKLPNNIQGLMEVC